MPLVFVPVGDSLGTPLQVEIRHCRAPVKPPWGQTLRSPRPRVTSVLTRHEGGGGTCFARYRKRKLSSVPACVLHHLAPCYKCCCNVMSSKQRDPNHNNGSLVRPQCYKRIMESFICRCVNSCEEIVLMVRVPLFISDVSNCNCRI